MTNTGSLAGHLLRPVTEPLAQWAARSALTPTRVHEITLLLAVLAAVWFTGGGPLHTAIGAVVLAAVLLADAFAAELPEGHDDALALWFGPLARGLREYIVYAGVAVGGLATVGGDVWGWATGAILAHALRTSVSTARRAEPAPASGGAQQPAEPLPATAGGRSARPLSPIDAVDPSRSTVPEHADLSLTDELLGAPRNQPAHTSANGRRQWPRRPRRGPRVATVAWFSQPTRFAVLAVTPVVWDARAAFLILIVGCALAVIVRSVGRPTPDVDR
ncbi:hypothetical protein [Salinactinospora qingdaonensis]|uniref:CDP-alcohol phosphatidyltransferase n=1 Tax=Salinactinospora qingdaonensis TaxID=702744 RepID=A0ABP7G0G9_9ACTN